MSNRDLAQLLAGATSNVATEWVRGVVTATSGNTVTVKILGATATIAGVRYPAGYTPAVNDVVEILQRGADRIIICKLA